MKRLLSFFVVIFMIISIGCDKDEKKSFPFSGTYIGNATVDTETSEMTLKLNGSWAPSLGEDGWDISGTVTVFEWENANIDGYYSPSGGLEFDTEYIGDYFFGVEGATHSSGTISGMCCKCTASGYGQKVGNFTATKQ